MGLLIGSLLILIIMSILVLLARRSRSRLYKPSLFILFLIAATVISSLAGKQKIVLAMENFRNWLDGPVLSSASLETEKEEPFIIKLKEKILIDVAALNQFPQLPRGCEVTSLAMLLTHAGVKADKLTLAKEVTKTDVPYINKNGQISFGHPNDGFVGDMYSYDNPGFGVYHKPIKKLAEQYLPGRIMDLTGSDFTELKIHLSDHRPVWVITNTTYQKLSKNMFETWQTPSGKIDITYKEHSVLLTGYDQSYVYFNDPLTGEKNKKAPIDSFAEAWVQMGSQAITYLSE
ncbi:C39 family peptidase [Cytobacillus gottheilii]|uniref:C39 family peptidase n=1 Tax=Cytobacillus gottheilii TaxID=859144 RepID=UPI000830F774|nr:C39 family peptidase [Cytobacillus gottheilii]